jgi:hypothetical protein
MRLFKFDLNLKKKICQKIIVRSFILILNFRKKLIRGKFLKFIKNLKFLKKINLVIKFKYRCFLYFSI